MVEGRWIEWERIEKYLRKEREKKEKDKMRTEVTKENKKWRGRT